MDALVVGDPACFTTDVGPVIDEEARTGLKAHRPVTMLFIAVVLKLGRVFGLSSNKGTSSLLIRLTTHSRQLGRSNNFVCTCSAQSTS